MDVDANQVLGSSKETENYRRLDRLIISGGTYVLRLLFDKKVPPNTLSTVLAALKRDLESARFISADEREKLYPSTGKPPSSHDFDITLFIKLLRRICSLKEPKNGWNNLPLQPEHQNLEDDLARIKFYRNNVHGHVTMMSIKDSEFEKLWSEISQPLLRIIHIVDPDKEPKWKEAIEVLRTAQAFDEREVNFERLLKMEIGEMRRSLTQQMREIYVTAEQNTASVRETKTAVEQVHETMLQALSSPNSANPGPAVVFNFFNINTNSNAAVLPETLLAANSYKRPTAVDNIGLSISAPIQPLESNVETGQRHVSLDHTRYQYRQRPQSEPTNMNLQGDTTARIPQGSAQQTVLRRPFSDPYGYGENKSPATNWSQTCAATDEPLTWCPRQNLYSTGAYEDRSEAQPAYRRFSTPGQNPSPSDLRKDASVGEATIVRHPPETGSLLGMSIECQKILWNDIELRTLKEDVNIAVSRLLSSQPSNGFVQYLEEEKGLIIEDVQMRNKICTLKLRALRQDYVESLLQDYRSGKLNDLANLYLVSDELPGCYGVSRSDIFLTVSIQSFGDCHSIQKEAQDFQRGQEPRASSPVLRFTEEENRSLTGMPSQKCSSNLTPLYGPAKDKATSKSAARELFQIICRHGGVLQLSEAIEGLAEAHRHVIESGHVSSHPFVEKFPSLFSLSNDQGSLVVHAVLAVQFCRNKGCSITTCPDLHVCPFYLVNSCSYNSLNCRRAHDVNGTHTERVLRGLDLEGLSTNEKATLLTKIANDTKLEWRTPGDEIAQVCSYYNVERGCAKDSCNRLHVCRFWIKGKCKFTDQCKRSHTYQSEREQRILKNYDMAGYSDAKINEILSPGIGN